MRAIQYIAIGAMVIISAGCACEINNFRDPHTVWLEWMNRQIGKPDIYSRKFYQDLVDKGYYEIIEYHGERAFKRRAPYWDWGFNGATKDCGVTTLVSISTMTVLGWEYAPGSVPELCVTRKKSCAW
jgi:hypothetical protein